MYQSEPTIIDSKNNSGFSVKRPANGSEISEKLCQSVLGIFTTQKSVKSILQQLIAGLAKPIQFLRKVDFSNNRHHRWDPLVRDIHHYHSYGFIPMDRK